METVFNPDVVVTEQALARKERFRKNKELGTLVHQDNFEDTLPKIWFDDLGEIRAVTYDAEFEPDSSWTTYDFDLVTLKMIKGNNPSYYMVVRTENKGEISYQIALRKNTVKRQITQDTGLTHAAKIRPDYPVDIQVTITEDQIVVELTDIGNQMITKHPEKYLTDNLKLYITEPMNVHVLLQELTVKLVDLITDAVVIPTQENYSLKSVYGQRPFVYGRV